MSAVILIIYLQIVYILRNTSIDRLRLGYVNDNGNNNAHAITTTF